ncbi:protein FAM71E2 isoform X2 [Sceloporus undulatus]|uniref:protein FAM71E2 isoform X2 n=1 Tax=Sceloporus undulatus TaxID=8520 RepID=UPI001C4C3375|nr:protein FAM71E2 isoform X2 [Sceloporus undulatus]
MVTRPPGKPLRKGLQDYPDFMNDEAFSGWAPSPGKLRSVLQRAEYNLLGDVPIFEGNFVQVTRKGEYIGIHNHPNIIIMGILASSPNMLLPDLMIIAREKEGTTATVPKSRDLEITRVIPLNLVEIFVQNVDERRLKVQFVTGRKYYLQLYAPGSDEKTLFDQWIRLIYLLHVVQGKIASKESGLHTIWKRDSLQAMSTKHWLPVIMDKKGSTEGMKKHLEQVYSASREYHSSTESDLTARENFLKPDFAGYASQGPLSNVGAAVPPSVKRDAAAMTQEHPPKQETHYSTSKAKKKSKAAKPSSRVPQSKKQPKPKPTSPQSKGRTISPITTKTLGAGPSHAVMSPVAAGPSRPANRISSPGASQAKSAQQFIPLISPGSEYASVKWQSSQKSRSFTQTVSAASTKEEYSEVQRKAASVKSQERTPVPSKLHWSSSQGRKQSPSLSPSTKQSRPMSSPASFRTSSTSPAPRTHISVAVGPSDLHSVPVAAGPSEAGGASIVAGPSKPASWVSHLTSDRRRSSVAPTEQERQGRSSPPHSQMTDLKPQEIKSHSSRQKSWSPSPKRGGSISPSRSRKEQPKPVPVRRTAESVAVGPSQAGWKTVAAGPSLPGYSSASNPQSQPSRVGKQSDTKSKSQKAKSKERSQSSSATEKQQKIGAQESDETKSKLKSALSAARNKSSLTFITIYSVLSSSFDKIKRSRSKDDNVKADDKNVARKPSKRVTISGVIGPSGKSVLQQEEEATNPHVSTWTDVDSNTAALKGMETEELRPPESHLSKNDTTSAGKIPAVEGNISEVAEPKKPESQIMARDPLVTNPEEARKTAERSSILRLGNQGASQVTSRTPEKLGSHVSPSKSSSKASQLKTSQKSLPNREVPRNAEGDSLPPRSKISVATGQSAVQLVSVAVGLSIQETINKKQTSKPSQQQSRKGDSQKSGSKLSTVLGSPFKSRASVGVGRSAVETRSMGVGRSLVDRVSQGAGPSKPTSKMGQRSQGKNLSKSQQLGFGDLEAKPIAKTMSSQKSKTATTSRPASSSHEPRDPSDMSRL